METLFVGAIYILYGENRRHLNINLSKLRFPPGHYGRVSIISITYCIHNYYLCGAIEASNLPTLPRIPCLLFLYPSSSGTILMSNITAELVAFLHLSTMNILWIIYSFVSLCMPPTPLVKQRGKCRTSLIDRPYLLAMSYV